MNSSNLLAEHLASQPGFHSLLERMLCTADKASQGAPRTKIELIHEHERVQSRLHDLATGSVSALRSLPPAVGSLVDVLDEAADIQEAALALAGAIPITFCSLPREEWIVAIRKAVERSPAFSRFLIQRSNHLVGGYGSNQKLCQTQFDFTIAQIVVSLILVIIYDYFIFANHEPEIAKLEIVIQVIEFITSIWGAIVTKNLCLAG